MMKKLFFLLIMTMTVAYGAGGAPIRLEKVKLNPKDRASLLRGAKYFASNCMVCHTMQYLTHNKLAKEAGVTLDKMPLKRKEWWLGIVPPDLTLLARRRSPDWIYTYLHSFYKDESRPTGYNNLLVKDINMPNQFVALQGEQVLTQAGAQFLKNPDGRELHYYTVLKLVKSGSATPEQFHQEMADLVNFFVYASDPGHASRIHLGVWVILFLVVFLILTILLKRAFWKDVPKSNDQ